MILLLFLGYCSLAGFIFRYTKMGQKGVFNKQNQMAVPSRFFISDSFKSKRYYFKRNGWIDSFTLFSRRTRVLDALPAKPIASQFYFLLPNHLNASITFSVIKKPVPFETGFTSSGSWTRTSDLWVMSPTSYLLLYPAMYVLKSII